MYNIPTYNHPKKSEDEPNPDKVTFFHHAAKISLFAPIILGIFLKGVEYGFKDSKSPALLITLGGAMGIVYLAGFCFGILALFGIWSHGTQGILVRAAFGIVLNLVLLGICGPNFVRGFQMAIKAREIVARARATVGTRNPDTGKEQTNSDNGKDLPKEVSGKDASTDKANSQPPTTTAAGNNKPTKDLPPDMALVKQARFIYQAKQQTLITAYEAAAKPLTAPPVMALKGVTQREQLLAKKELLNKYLDANEKLLGFITGAEPNFRAELVKLHASSSTIETALKEYRKTAADRDFVVMKLRTSDHRIGASELALLSVLDTNWGQWTYNEEKNNLAFKYEDVGATYNQSFTELNAAKAEQMKLQGELATMPDPATNAAMQ